MSYPIGITPASYRSIAKSLRTTQEVLCLDPPSYLRTLLVAQKLVMRGEHVAKVVKAYSEVYAEAVTCR